MEDAVRALAFEGKTTHAWEKCDNYWPDYGKDITRFPFVRTGRR